jgi:putative DNA primase/helicase
MDYETMLKKYQQEQKLRFVVREWKKQGGERQAKLLMLINDYDKEISPHFTLLTPEDRMRIFHDEYPETELRFHYQTSHERLEFHEVGNAQRFIDMYGKDILHVTPEGQGWFAWDGKRWKEDDDQKQVFRFAKDAADSLRKRKTNPQPLPKDAPKELKEAYLEEKKQDDAIESWMRRSLSKQGLQSTITLASKEQAVSAHYTDLNTHPYFFNAYNGTVDLRTGEIGLQKREHRMTQLSPVSYVPTHPCPHWIEFLKTIFQDDDQMIRYIQWLFGYFLIGHNANQKLFIFTGSGKNGKSTILKVARALMGPEYAKLTDFSVLSQSTEVKSARNDLASFLGKRLIIVSESNRDQVLAEGCVKRFTGEDTIVAEKKYGHPFDIPVTFNVVMMTQHLPRIIGQDTGIWRRLVVIPFEYQIPEEDRDPKYFEHTLEDELPGILAWAVEGAKMYHDVREADLMPDVCERALNAYREDTDFFGQFVQDCLIMEDGSFLPQEQLLEVAKKWGQINNCQSLVNSGIHNFKTMFETNPLTKKIATYNRRRVPSIDGTDNRRYGFDNVTLSDRGKELLLGKDAKTLNFLDQLSANFRMNSHLN